MGTGLNELFTIFVRLIFIIKRRVKNRSHLILLIIFNILLDVDFSCGDFIFCRYIENCIDFLLLKLPNIWLLVWERTNKDISIPYFRHLKLPLEVCIALIDHSIDKENTVCVELFACSLRCQLSCVMVGVVHLKNSLWVPLNYALVVFLLLIIVFNLELFPNESSGGISV